MGLGGRFWLSNIGAALIMPLLLLLLVGLLGPARTGFVYTIWLGMTTLCFGPLACVIVLLTSLKRMPILADAEGRMELALTGIEPLAYLMPQALKSLGPALGLLAGVVASGAVASTLAETEAGRLELISFTLAISMAPVILLVAGLTRGFKRAMQGASINSLVLILLPEIVLTLFFPAMLVAVSKIAVTYLLADVYAARSASRVLAFLAGILDPAVISLLITPFIWLA